MKVKIAAKKMDSGFMDKRITHRRIDLEKLSIFISILISVKNLRRLFCSLSVALPELGRRKARAEDPYIRVNVEIPVFCHHTLVSF